MAECMVESWTETTQRRARELMAFLLFGRFIFWLRTPERLPLHAYEIAVPFLGRDSAITFERVPYLVAWDAPEELFELVPPDRTLAWMEQETPVVVTLPRRTWRKYEFGSQPGHSPAGFVYVERP